MKIVFLDRNTIGFDIDVSIFKAFGELEEHNSCAPELSKEYIKDADIVIFNKVSFIYCTQKICLKMILIILV